MKYKTVVIDFPWPIKLAESPETLQGSKLGNIPYESFSVDALFDFDINEFAANKALLFIWATAGKTKNGTSIMELAFRLIRHWGFTYRQTLYWQKNKSTPAIFTPFRHSIEPILFASRNIAAIPPYGRFSDIFQAPRAKHSQKPAKFYQLLREWTPKPRIDLFARRAHEGFNGWGDEYVAEGPLVQYLEVEKQKEDER